MAEYTLNPVWLLVGILLVILGIIQAVAFSDPHFYTAFSVGLTMLMLSIYRLMFKKDFFKGWSTGQFTLYIVASLVACIIIDQIGISLGYWHYPKYSGLLDEGLKYFFEWFVAFQYLMLAFVICREFIYKTTQNLLLSILVGLVGVSIVGLFTEFLNHSASSWQVLSMPITNLKIGSYFIVFQTIGYWLTALIPLFIYSFVAKLRLK